MQKTGRLNKNLPVDYCSPQHYPRRLEPRRAHSGKARACAREGFEMNALRLACNTTRRVAFYGIDVLLPAFGIPKVLGYLATLLLLYWMGNYAYLAVAG